MNLFERFRRTGQPAHASHGDHDAAREQQASHLIDEGNAIEDQGRLSEALQRYDAAISMAPQFARAHLNRGNVLLATGDGSGALRSYQSALALDPGYAAAHYNIGNAYAKCDRPADALDAYRAALALKPDFADAEVAAGCLLEDLGSLDEAVACYRRALAINPDYAEVHCNLSTALMSLRRLDDAVASGRRAVELKPDLVNAHINMGNALHDLGRIDEAVASYRCALSLDPDQAAVHTSLLFCLAQQERLDPDALFAEHCRFAERFESPLRPSWPRHVNSRDPARHLKIGFVSADLRNHPVTYFIEPVLAHLARSPDLSLYTYYNHAEEGEITRRLRGYVKGWRSVAAMSDTVLAQRIGEDGIDILVDLSGHTSENRLLTFARKPAPVQASWMGYPATTGLRSMDYYLADPHFLPPGRFDDQFTEKLVYLPANVPFQPDERAPPVNRLPALDNGYVTFASFNRISKLNPSTIALWCRLLRALPDARMVLGGMPGPGEYDALIEQFARERVGRDRLEFHSRCGTAAYLGLHHRVDLCLDPIPYGGGTTTALALWMGVPTLTCAGATPPGRQAAAMLAWLGLDEFTAIDADDFERRGISWAGNLGGLAELRSGLRGRFERSALGRPEVVAAGFERALRIMWERWCAGLPAQVIDVAIADSEARRIA